MKTWLLAILAFASILAAPVIVPPSSTGTAICIQRWCPVNVPASSHGVAIIFGHRR